LVKVEEGLSLTKKPYKILFYRAFAFLWCEPGLNRRHMDFQSIALPTELSHHISKKEFKEIFPLRGCKNKEIFLKMQDIDRFIL
jgi:hypothetical protein